MASFTVLLLDVISVAHATAHIFAQPLPSLDLKLNAHFDTAGCVILHQQYALSAAVADRVSDVLVSPCEPEFDEQPAIPYTAVELQLVNQSTFPSKEFGLPVHAE